MVKPFSAFCGATLLCGCATTHPSSMAKAELSAEYFCTDVPFPTVSGCVRSQFDKNYPRWHSDANADLVNIFLSWTSAEAERVIKGEVSQADAMARAQTLQRRLDQLANARRARAQINSEIAAQEMLAGLAIMASAQQQPVVVAPQPVAPASRQPYLAPPPPDLFRGSAPVVHGSAVQAPQPAIPEPIICNTMVMLSLPLRFVARQLSVVNIARRPSRDVYTCLLLV
jgi:hypothetical protein